MLSIYKIVCKLNIIYSGKYQLICMINEAIHNLRIIYSIPLCHIPIPYVPTPGNKQILFKGITYFNIYLPCYSLTKIYFSSLVVLKKH